MDICVYVFICIYVCIDIYLFIYFFFGPPSLGDWIWPWANHYILLFEGFKRPLYCLQPRVIESNLPLIDSLSVNMHTLYGPPH